MEKYTPIGIKQIITVLERKEREMYDAVIACHSRKKNEHPRYEAMSDDEFKRYKVDFIREMNAKRKENRQEKEKFEKMLKA